MSLPPPNPVAAESADSSPRDPAHTESKPESSSAESSAPEFSPEFSSEERAQLLCLAHESILSALENRSIPLDPPTAHLAEPRGVFTTLYLRGALRGCIGYVLPISPLYHAVAGTARAAALQDSRFPHITLLEAPDLEIELSILSPPQHISPEAIEIGRHGLLISMIGLRGLLLPQVPVEHHWNRLTFLEQTCRKAGIPLDAWQKKGTTLEAFTAEVFGEKH